MKKLLLLIIVCFSAILANAQWTTFGLGPATFNNSSSGLPLFQSRCVGIGNFPGNGASPLAKLQINEFFLLASSSAPNGSLFRTDGRDVNSNQWQMFTGTTAANATEKLRIFTGTGIGLVNNLNNITFQASQRDMIFNTGGNNESMRITGVARILNPANLITTYPVNPGSVGINTPSPTVMLQVGGNVTNGGGYRDWMNVGALYQFGTDNMYTGYNNLTGDATINWGNNPTIDGIDRLVFNFTAVTGGAFQASGIRGLEASRWVTNGNRFFVGFGGDPNNVNQNPYTNNPDPGNTVEINSAAIVVGPTNSGLRFTDLNSTSGTIANPGAGVLSVDAVGDVIYVPGGGATTAPTCTSPITLTANGAIALSGNNFYFDGQTNPERVAIGRACGTPINAKLEVFAAFAPNVPQLRLSTTPGFLGAFFTDFQTTATGNLRINPSDGFLGLDPRMGINIPQGNEPSSLLHLNQNFASPVYNQATNATTGLTATDGTKSGILDDGTSLLYNQENQHLLFSTNTATPANAAAATNERVRVTAIGTPGTTNPGGLANNLSRVSISHDPALPVTRPLSLLHLGYNTGSVFFPNQTDGWRDWMDVGTFTGNGTDNMYVGLKNENGFLGDRQDAIINWGDNAGLPTIGPDNLRFIFTSTTGIGVAPFPANGNDGLEGMRLTPTVSTFTGNSSIFTGIGGDPSSNLYSTGITAGNALEVNSTGPVTNPGGSSGLRFTDLNSTSPVIPNPGTGVLTVDAAGDVIYVPGGAAGIGDCIAGPTILSADGAIDMNLNDFYFIGQDLVTDRVAVGLNCGDAINAKLDVQNNVGGAPLPIIPNRTVVIEGLQLVPSADDNVFGVYGLTLSVSKDNVGVFGHSIGAGFPMNANIGVRGIANNAGSNWGGNFTANSNAGVNYGVHGQGSGSPVNNWGGHFSASGTGAAINYGIQASVATPIGGSPTDVAGLFNGDIDHTGNINFLSDSTLKENIDTINDALSIINQLAPKKYNFKTVPYLALPIGPQFGLIAQEVDGVLPELVSDIIMPDERDSLGIIINPTATYKGINYTGLIPIAIQGIKELDARIDSLTLSGVPGPTGATGAAGLTGATGADGIAGAPGVNGATGPAGANGINGTNGAIGATGAQGIPGPTGPAGSGWALTGNAGTVDGTNFIGTTDNTPFSIRVNNKKAGRIEPVLLNSFYGYQAGNVNVLGSLNTAVGANALLVNLAGSANTALGASSFLTGALFSNSTALGYNASITAGSQVRIGNNTVGSIGGFTNWTNVSDARFKKDVEANVPGLEFISKLRPVTYHLDMDNIASLLQTPDSLRLKDSEAVKGAMLQTGFVAQEVEKAAQEIGYDFSGVDKPKNQNDFYGLRYAEFTVPLVKAVQELNVQNIRQQQLIEDQQQQINDLRNDLVSCCNAGFGDSEQGASDEGNVNVVQLEAFAKDLPILSQNRPNPFDQTTLIRFYLPKGTKGASIKVFDNAGAVYRLFALTGEGPGSIEIEANTLAAGTYYYSLLVENTVFDTKTMMITR